MPIAEDRGDEAETVAARYRQCLHVSGSDPRKGRSFSPEQVAAVMRKGGKLGMAQLLRCRLRYMTQGTVIGSKAFVEEWMRERRGESAFKLSKAPAELDGFDEDVLFTANGRA